MAEAAGLPGLYLVAEVSDLLGGGPVFTDVEAAGFDAGVYVRIPADRSTASILRMRVRRKFRKGPEVYPHSVRLPEPPNSLAGSVPLHPCVYPNWDNTPRSSRRGVVLRGSQPQLFERHVAEAARRARAQPEKERLIFVKSWNEWAEGNYLEPDRQYGHAWLEALQQGLQG
jgi:hypothetical protein